MKTVKEFYKESEYSKIDFGSNPKLFSEKELLDFANEYAEAIKVIPCCESDSEQLCQYDKMCVRKRINDGCPVDCKDDTRL